MGKQDCKDFRTVGGIVADGRELADGSQEVGVGVSCILIREECLKAGLRENLLHSLDI